MKRTSSRPSPIPKHPKKQQKPQQKLSIPLKPRNRKNNENTASTLASRSSMDSKFTKRKWNTTEHKNRSCRIQLLKERGSTNCEEAMGGGGGDREGGGRSRFAIRLEENGGIGVDGFEEGLVSFREYCMVGDRWVPLLSLTQRQRIVNPSWQKKNQPTSPISTKSQAIQAETTPPKKQTCKITQTLEKLKQQLQLHDNQLEEIPAETKEYYYKILKNVISKLEDQNDVIKTPYKSRSIQGEYLINKKGNRNKQIQNDVSIEDIDINTHSEKQVLNKPCQSNAQHTNEQCSPVKNLKFDDDPQPLQQSIQDMIKLRQLKQLGLLPPTLHPQSPHSPTISTDLSCITEYIQKILQVIKQGSISAQIVRNIKQAWGYQKREKLSRIRRNKYLGSSGEVLPEYLFEYVEDYLGKNNLYQFIHNKCIFDCINQELVKLKPFYESNGETFPWNFMLSMPLTFFQVDQSSLQLAFQQIKLKLLESNSNLCGLILQIDPCHPQYQVLLHRRQSRQDLMFKKYTQIEEFKNAEENLIQNYSVLVLEAVEIYVMMELMGEVVEDLGAIGGC